ncbi:septation protein SepH [Pseudonocardia nantongensis]|uniref:septation protein SepH n=1 Tax=Pseudonocardia nantongensis TaxID=1181885 RepID=UPI0039794E73
MRALRVVGVTGEGSVVLEDPGRRERYTVPADEQLRAAARGDVTRLGQIAIELESQLRPREIQARIRGGASVDEVAAAAGVPVQKIERFAYPVLLERSRTAELAQGAHPQRADGPDSRTLGETVAHTFGLRGQDYATAGWDSWKGDDGKWVVALTWQTGRSDNAARWAFQPGAHGGTVVPLDEHASDLVEGLPARPLRPLGAVVDMARDEEPAPDHDDTVTPARAVAAGGQAPPPTESWAGRGIAPEQRRSSPPPARQPASAPIRTAAPALSRPASSTSSPDPAPADEAPAEATPADRAPAPTTDGEPAGPGAEPPAPEAAPATASATEEPVETTADDASTGPATAAPAAAGAPTDGTPVDEAPVEEAPTEGAQTDEALSAEALPDEALPDEALPGDRPADGAPADGASSDEAKPRGGASSRRTKKGKPVMPSWDEVLLGVRGQR